MKGKKLKTKPVKAVSAPKEKVESQLTVKIAWVNAKKGMAGVSFEKLTEQQKQQLDNLLKKMNQTAG